MLKGNKLKGLDLYFEVNAFVCLFVFVLLFWGHKHSAQVHEAYFKVNAFICKCIGVFGDKTKIHSAQVHEAEFAEEQFWATPPDSTDGNHADCALLSR